MQPDEIQQQSHEEEERVLQEGPVQLRDTKGEILAQITSLLKEHKRSDTVISILKKDNLWLWIEEASYSLLLSDQDAEKLYQFVHEPNIQLCPQGHTKKFVGYAVGYRNCGPANKCACTAHAVSASVSATKLEYSDETKDQVQQKREATNLARYGERNKFCNTESMKSIWLNTLGVDNPRKREDIKQKACDTNMIRYGVVNPAQNESIQNKAKQTCLQKYGCENPMHNADVKSRHMESIKDKYGVGNVAHTPAAIAKRVATNLKRFGTVHAWQSSEIQDKIRATRRMPFAIQFIETAKQLHQNRYDYSQFTYLSLKPKSTIICPDHGPFEMSAYQHIIQSQGCPSCFPGKRSWREVAWLNSLSVPVSCRQIRIVTPTGKRYYVDALVDNTVYEFWGDFWHGNPKVFDPQDVNPILKKSYGQLYEETLTKIHTLQQMGYQIVDVWESDWVSSNKSTA